jgi:outer membrane protein
MLNLFPRILMLGAMVSVPVSSSWGISLLEVYQQAVINDTTLHQAAANRQANQEVKPQARALMLPQIGAGATVTQEFASSPSDSLLNGNANIQLTQALYNRGNWALIRQAGSTVEQADADYLSSQQELIFRVAQSYFNVLLAGDDLTFTRADKNAIDRQLNQAKERFEVGLITITDVQEAQARYDLVVADEITATNNLADRKEELREITGEYYENLAGLSDRMPLTVPEPQDIEAWEQLARDNSPILDSANFTVDIARENIELQRSDHYPTLDLVTGYSDTRFELDELNSRGGQIGLQLQIPIYTGGAVNSRTREAAYQHESAKEFREGRLRAVIRELRNSYRGLQAAISRVHALDQARVSNRGSLDATQAGFEVGTRTIVDVLDAQRELYRAERDYAEARYAYILNLLRLKQAAGIINEQDVVLVDGWLDDTQ